MPEEVRYTDSGFLVQQSNEQSIMSEPKCVFVCILLHEHNLSLPASATPSLSFTFIFLMSLKMHLLFS